MQYAPADSAPEVVKRLVHNLVDLLPGNLPDSASSLSPGEAPGERGNTDWYWQFSVLLDQATYGGEAILSLFTKIACGDTIHQYHSRIFCFG
jgi:hypothetical protein